MNDFEDFPVRDSGGGAGSPKQNRDAAQQLALRNQLIAKLERSELEDKYMRLYEDHIKLKKYARKQEEKIKKLATLQLRLNADRKRLMQEPGGGGRKAFDAQAEDFIKQLQNRIEEVEKQNLMLKARLATAKQGQVFSIPAVNQGTPYGHVSAVVDTGIPHLPVSERQMRISRSLRVAGPSNTATRRPQSAQQMKSLEEARSEKRQLQGRLASMEEEIIAYQKEITALTEKLKAKDSSHEEELLLLRQKRSSEQRATISENTELIRLQRENKEYASNSAQMHAKFVDLEEKSRRLKLTNEQLLREMEDLNHQLSSEQSRTARLQNQLQGGSTSHRQIIEHEQRVRDLENECQLLKEANERLMNSAFDLEKEREWKKRENALKVQIAQLEATLKADVGEKGGILDQLSVERDGHDKLETEYRELRKKHLTLQQQHLELTERMKYFSKDSAIDFSELDEALVIVRQRREGQGQQLDFLQQVEDEQHKDVDKLLKKLQAEHADTINELEKTRNMLIVQHKINKDYQTEVEVVTKKMEELKREYETRLDEYAQLLDIKSARIKKLEMQMKDVAYGTRQYKVKADEDGVQLSDDEDVEETIDLELGQNLFEIHVKRITLTEQALKELNDKEPNVFCTWEFYEFELQTTPVMRGPRADFEMTSQYIVVVDDFFLHYLQKDSCVIELHQSFGTDYHTVAAGHLRMRDLLERTTGRLHGSIQLTGIGSTDTGVPYGTVEYWVRLKVPMEQALRLYKERSKAMGYLESNLLKAGEQSELTPTDSVALKRAPNNVNQLNITIARCSNVQARRNDMQPNLFCVYKLFDLPDHDTQICVSSNSPQFDDSISYPLPMTSDLDKYLKSQPLKIYLFDDTDPDPQSVVGVASVPLIPLAHDKSITGTFEIKKKDGTLNGTIDVNIRWQYGYISPLGAIPTTALYQTEPAVLEEAATVKSTKPTSRPSSVKSSQSRPASVKSTTSKPTSERSAAGSKEKGSVKSGGKPSSVKSGGGSESAAVPAVRAAKAREENQQNDQSPSPVPRVSKISMDRGSKPASEAGSIVSEGSHVTGESDNVSDLGEEEEVTPRPRPDIAPRVKSTSPHSQQLSDSELDPDIEVPSSRREQEKQDPSDVVKVVVGHVSLDDGASVLDDDAAKMLFVEYRFLGEPLEETETPYSLPKPSLPHQPINFNFSKVFRVDYDQNYERRQHLASMLLPDDPNQGRIRFTVVSEPQDEDTDADCVDVGVAYVSVLDILHKGRDVINQEIPIYDVNNEAVRIGSLGVTVECLAALRVVEQQLTHSNATSLA